MADTIIAKAESAKKFPLPSEGQQQGVCVDVIDCGEEHNAKWNKLEPKVAIVFQVEELNPETNKRFEVFQKCTITMAEKAHLRKFLAQWRGKSYSDDEAKEVPLHKLEGVNGMLTIEHNTKGEKTYANIFAIAPLPKGVPKMVAENYERAKWWAEKRTGTQPTPTTTPAKAAAAAQNFEDFPASLEDEEDDLPF